jgi:hypothetical protein
MHVKKLLSSIKKCNKSIFAPNFTGIWRLIQ